MKNEYSQSEILFDEEYPTELVKIIEEFETKDYEFMIGRTTKKNENPNELIMYIRVYAKFRNSLEFLNFKFPKLPKNLQQLFIFNCNLKEIPELPKTLKILNISKNPIKKFPKEFPPNLKELRMVNCGLKKLPKCVSDLIHLEYLNLSENEFKTIPKILPVSLKKLDISECKNLTKITNKLPLNLEIFKANNCNITNFPDFSKLKNLLWIILVGNKLQNVKKIVHPRWMFINLSENNLPKEINNIYRPY